MSTAPYVDKYRCLNIPKGCEYDEEIMKINATIKAETLKAMTGSAEGCFMELTFNKKNFTKIMYKSENSFVSESRKGGLVLQERDPCFHTFIKAIDIVVKLAMSRHPEFKGYVYKNKANLAGVSDDGKEYSDVVFISFKSQYSGFMDTCIRNSDTKQNIMSEEPLTASKYGTYWEEYEEKVKANPKTRNYRSALDSFYAPKADKPKGRGFVPKPKAPKEFSEIEESKRFQLLKKTTFVERMKSFQITSTTATIGKFMRMTDKKECMFGLYFTCGVAKAREYEDEDDMMDRMDDEDSEDTFIDDQINDMIPDTEDKQVKMLTKKVAKTTIEDDDEDLADLI